MIVIFDVLGTLFSLDRIRARFEEKQIPTRLMDLWMAELIQSSMAMTLAARYTQLKVLAHAELKHLFAGHGINEAHFDAVFGSLRDIEPDEQAIACLNALRSDGHRLVVLTNNTIDDTERLLERWGIRSHFEQLFSADQAKVGKPGSMLYEMVMRSLRSIPADCCLVSAHSWDVLGASSAGMNTIYVAQLEKNWRYPLHPPGFVVSNLSEVAPAINGKFGRPATKAA